MWHYTESAVVEAYTRTPEKNTYIHIQQICMFLIDFLVMYLTSFFIY